MISSEDAHLLLSGWAEHRTPLLLVFADKSGGSVATLFGRVFVTAVDMRGLVSVESADGLRCALVIRDAEFAYADRRDTLPFMERKVNLQDAVCAVRVRFPDGAVAMLVEERENTAADSES